MVPSCAEGGVLGVVPGIVGTIQALETIKLLLGLGNTLAGRLLIFDALRMTFRELTLKRDPLCPVCGDEPTVTELIDYERFCGIEPAGEETMGDEAQLSVTELKEAIDRGDELVLIDVREPHEWDICNLGPQGATMIPMSKLPGRMSELDPESEIVVYCRTGARSARVTTFLRGMGYSKARNLEGGINAWSDEVDPSIQKY
jgi:adenylyltransferase/sulfurtransferase